MRARPAAGPSGDKPATDPLVDEGTPAQRRQRRQRAVVAGHTGAVEDAQAASHDPDPTVRAAAYGALARLGPWDPAMAVRAATDPDPAVRRRACELTGRAPSAPAGIDPVARPTLVALLVGRLADEDPGVVEMAAWALGELVPAADDGAGDAAAPEGTGSPDTGDGPARQTGAAVDALMAVAGRHEDPLCREAAVAALGAIGDPAGLDAVLAALDGRPPLRRRAAVALAAFDDPRAEAALARCLTDRDWQVREVAEELLGRGPGEQAPS